MLSSLPHCLLHTHLFLLLFSPHQHPLPFFPPSLFLPLAPRLLPYSLSTFYSLSPHSFHTAYALVIPLLCTDPLPDCFRLTVPNSATNLPHLQNPATLESSRNPR
ncbi:hypothetical protein BJX96DRAFT_65209 [Aspergillus floccosus]